ncbi:hypothetical protein D5S17_33905 [Pseudonocardiaceae bacterium YIM PH 21723]|nr:hypothetical protein D5S17_33905 [Pseudonocardiaceae bacterium YIM PH 21723]
MRWDVLRGRWLAARDLFAHTGDDWDLRTHRMQVLAQAGAEYRAADEWHRAEPRNRDARALLTYTEVARCFLATEADQPGADVQVQRTRKRGLELAGEGGGDPVPLVALLTLARLLPVDQHAELWSWLAELRHRDRYNREGHLQVLIHLFARCHGSHQQMYAFAAETAAAAPSGDPLHVLPLLAHTENFAATGPLAWPALSFHWSGPDGLRYLNQAYDRWWLPAQERLRTGLSSPHAQLMIDCNYLAHGLSRAGYSEKAAGLFRQIGSHATRLPWAHSGPDALRTFEECRNRAFVGA